MGQSPLYGPMFIQMALTLTILPWLAFSRVSLIKKHGMAHIKKNGFPTRVTNISDNFKNQFEIPVIFYALCIFFIISGTATNSVLAAAWIFVISRIFHTSIHLTKNIIFPYRFTAFLIGAVALMAMLVMAIMQHFAS